MTSFDRSDEGVEATLAEIRRSIVANTDVYADDPVAAADAANIFITLRRTATAVQRALEDDARRHSISPSEGVVLLALAAAHGQRLPPVAIARQLAVSVARLTPLIASLEGAGLVARTRDADNRRVSYLSLSAAGRRFVRRFAPAHYRAEAGVIAALSREERVALLRLLDRLRNAIGVEGVRAAVNRTGVRCSAREGAGNARSPCRATPSA